MNLQHMIDGLSAEWQRQRAKTQLTLGGLIALLEQMEPTAQVPRLNNPHSFRGYYEDLAFEPSDEFWSASELLTICRKCMGEVFEGYKGGDFVMGALTPLWVAFYGSCGDRLMGIEAGKPAITAPDDE